MGIAEKIDNWLEEILKTEEYNFEYKGSLTIYSKDKPFCMIKIFPSSVPPDHPGHLEKTLKKTSILNPTYFVTSNLRDTILWRTPKKGVPISREYCLKNYFTIQQISTVPNLVINPFIEALLKQRVEEILLDIKTLSEIGHLYAVDIDASFFVHRLHQAVEKISPLLKKSFSTQLYLKPQFKKDIYAWAVKQGIANYEQKEFLQALSRQIVYRLLGKIIFYESLRRYLKELPEPDFSFLDPSLILEKLAQCFEKARHIDYQVIFEEEIIDKAPYPENALLELQSLLEDLHKYNFSRMPQDVIGKVFEELIPYEERHALGQYFTREDLVDFINAFCIRNKDDFILDPTCGTGTFLIRGYDRLKFLGERNHKKLLQNLWGIDIAKFPAQLATINLYRQRIEDFENFPRIISKDFFEVTEDTVFQFPSSRNDFKNKEFIKELIPKFDCVIGNFPYIRQEIIEKKIKGYKKFLGKVLAKDWLIIYPNAFKLNKKDKLKDYLENNVDISSLFEKTKLKLSGQADVYAYLFFHCGHFLKEGGRMGIVTSNAWLDVAYGHELQKFFLENFKIIAIVESRCEPWFEDAAVNTLFTILERCSDEKERQNHLVKFVKLKKKLKELIPWDMKFSNLRWQGIDTLVQKIENTGSELYNLEETKFVCTLKGHKTYENNNFRIRVLRQGELLEELAKEDKTAKWGKYLRAPEVYFEILEKCKDKLVRLKEIGDVETYLNTGGADKFFFIPKNKIDQLGIPNDFLTPMVKSSNELSATIKVPKEYKTKWYVLTIDGIRYSSKDTLPTRLRKYIEHGERERFNKASGRKNKTPWYYLPKQAFEGSPVVIGRTVNDTHIVYFNPAFLVTNRFYRFCPKDKKETKLIVAILNSSLFALIRELISPINMGEGALNTYNVDQLRIPNPECFSENKEKILNIFDKMEIRSIKPIFEEVKMKDRQKLDSAILEALALDPKVYLPKIHDGLCELVKERLELPKMRKKVKKTKGKRNAEKLKEDIIKEVLPEGAKKFPEDFWDINIKRGTFKELNLPEESLKFSQPFFAEVKISTQGGFSYKTKNPAEVKYIKYAKFNSNLKVKIPQEPISVLKTVTAYERYIRDLRNKLFETFYNRTHDQKISHSLVQSVFEELKIAEIQE